LVKHYDFTKVTDIDCKETISMSSLLRIDPLYVKKLILLLNCEILLNNFKFIKGYDFLF